MERKPLPPKLVAPETSNIDYAKSVKIGKRLQKIGRMIDRELEKAVGERVTFTLLAHFGGRSQYVSNGERDNMREVMQELLDRWDSNPDLGVPEKKLGGL